MLKNRQTYVDASQVFGEVHRFVLLRSLLAIGSLLRGILPPEDLQSIWPAKDIIYSGNEDAISREAERSGDLQRHTLLRILMDTPVKFAYTACATGWFLELDKKRGRPQIFMMLFEPLELAIRRMMKFD
jgi:hypothetical protein